MGYFPTEMVRRCGTWLVLLALVVTTGAHWAVLQITASSGMLVEFAQQGSFREAVTKTFDGQHPCRLCRVVRDGRAEERDRTPPSTWTKLDLLPLPPAASMALEVQGEPLSIRRTQECPVSRQDSPPVPPPRAA